MVLDDGTALPAHSLYLQHASTVFYNALACSKVADCIHQTAPRPDSLAGSSAVQGPPQAKLPLPLPNTSKEQALLLLHCMYAFDRAKWAKALQPYELAALAAVAHRFGCLQILELADSALLQASAADAGFTTVKNAPTQHQLARRLQLVQFELHVARFLGSYPNAVDLSKLDPGTAAVLEGARQACKRQCLGL